MPDLTIIIVTYNSSNIILTALKKLNFQKYKIIIVDNNSTDDTVLLIKKNFPDALIIQNNKNCGFARANNIALKETKTEFALILNPDCFIEENDIEKVIKVMKNNSRIALASAVCHNCVLDKNQQLINIHACPVSQRNLLTNKGDFSIAKFVSGACMFMRISTYKKIGFFDENFFLYCEDNELNKRTKKRGYDIAVANGAKFYHLSGQSSDLESRNLYFIQWHKFGWSKMYYTQAVHNKLIAKLKAIRKITEILIKMVIDLIKYKKIALSNKATLSGSFAYLIGLKAFDKKGNPRKSII